VTKKRLDNKEILEIIKIKAKEKNMKLKDIDGEMGMKEGYLSTMASKKKKLFGLDVMYSVAEILGCDICELLVLPVKKPEEITDISGKKHDY
jgi:DNA-binding Xre family transcriptional regulator